MKYFLLILLIAAGTFAQIEESSSSSFRFLKENAVCSSTFTDPRDKRKYKIKRVGDYRWFLYDLAYKKEKYTWTEAKSACPEGWRLPQNIDWKLLKADAKADDLKEFSKIDSGYWWSIEENGNVAYIWHYRNNTLSNSYTSKTNTISVRCVQNYVGDNQ
jgi:hypothetical protein